jgi:homospermidine synthase
MNWPVHAAISGPVVIIGFGSIGRGTLPLILRHFDLDRSRITVMDPDDRNRALAEEQGCRFMTAAITEGNYRDTLKAVLAGPGQGFIVNLSVDVSSAAIIELAQELDVLYIDTVAEPWRGFYTDPSLTLSQRSNYALRESILDVRRRRPGGSTAINCCGANPGMVSWFVKQALLNLAGDLGLSFEDPRSRDDWARLMQNAGVKGVHIAERDTQRAVAPKPMGVFVNTWSVEGFVSEGLQPADSAGAPTRKGCLQTVTSMISARERRSTCRDLAPERGCALGRLLRARSTGSWSPITKLSP